MGDTSRQVIIGGWIFYVVILVLLAISCGFAIAIADSNQNIYRIVTFFTVLAIITIIIGTFSLTFPI
jgi:hypothetical protein